MTEINLMAKYPQAKRNLKKRGAEKTPKVRAISRKFGKEFFDGNRKYGYGGFYYDQKYWRGVVRDFQNHYELTKNSSVLDIGCGKGFMLHDFKELIPELRIAGMDISTYAIENALDDMKPFLKVGNAKKLPYPDKSFDLVISINTVHNLELDDCKKALQEVMRVTKKNAFITVDAYRNAGEKARMEQWNLTARTYMHVDEWKKLFDDIGYTGDYWWFIP